MLKFTTEILIYIQRKVGSVLRFFKHIKMPLIPIELMAFFIYPYNKRVQVSSLMPHYSINN
jgi:hypothetical protein